MNEMKDKRTKVRVSARPILTDPEAKGIMQKYATISTGSLMMAPSLPLNGGPHELVRLHWGIKRNVALCRQGAGNMSDCTWVRDWEIVIEKHLLRATRSLSPQAEGKVKDQVTSGFIRLGAKLDAGMSGPEGVEFLLRTMSRELSTVAAADMITELQRLVVEEGKSHKEYLGVVRALVQRVVCVGAGGEC